MLAALVSLVTRAESVSRTKAFNTAQQYLLAKGKILNQNRAPYRSVRSVEGQPQSTYYYVFNAEGENGYVIVSGDDRTPEILGYVDNGSFDEENIPDNMKSWLQLYVDQIKFLIDNNITVDKRALKARALAQATRHSVPILVTTRWNQGKPYNITCPNYYKEDDTEEESPLPLKSGPATGCTATAMAQVMNFYKYPAKLKAQIPGYTITYYSKKNGSSKSVTQKAIPRNTAIDWDNMQDRYNWEDGHVANVHDSAVANLMHMCGQAVNMHYGPSSGANFSAEAYIKYFGFDTSCYVGERGNYTIDDWFSSIYNELAQGYPVLFSGFSSGGGHAFVVDGFDGEQLFHLNWGWGGGSDGWFLIGILNPGDNSGIGASSSSDGYSMSQRALFNLRLPDNNNADTYLFIKDVSVNGTSIKATFENRTTTAGSFHTAIVTLDDDGELSVVGNQQTISSMAAGSSQTKSFTIKGKLPEGTYKLSPASKATKNDVWRPKFNLRNHYIEAVVDTAGNVTLTPVDISNGYSISIDTIVFPGSRIVGKEQEVKVTYRNDGDEYFREVRFFASQTDEKIYTESRSIVAVRKGETVEVSYFFTPEEVGTYNLWFCTGSDGSGQVGTGTMEVISEAEAKKATLAVNSFTITNSSSDNVYGNRLIGTVNVRNSGKEPFNGKIKLQLWHQPGGSGTAWSSTSYSVEMSIAPSKTATASFEYDNLNYGDKYYIAVSSSDANISGGGIWDHGWKINPGILYWKTNGTVAAQASKASFMVPSTAIATYVNNVSITRMTANSKNNPNTIYYFAVDTKIPTGTVTEANLVSGSHAEQINLTSEHPYYIPESFEADTANFYYTFPSDIETEVVWQTITLPFVADSIKRGDFTYQLNDSLNHFWIYEFTATDENGNPIFSPAKELRANTPYLIACDSMFKGLTITFTGAHKNFFKTGSDKMVISSDTYNQYGCTYSPTLKDVYMINAQGTAFEYITKSTPLTAMSSYFTTKLAEEKMLEQILLPSVPQSSSKPAGWGDVNLDQVIDESDVNVLAKTLVLKAPEGTGIEYGDVDGDGKITIADIVLLINQVIQ